MTDYLVAGGAGFIGCNIVRALAERGESVRVFDNFQTGRRINLEGLEDRIDLCEGDLRDTDAVKEAVKGVRYVFLLAALPSVMRSVENPGETNEVNVTGMLNLMLAARDAGVERVVFSSSSSVYGDTPELPKREDMLPRPLSPYALSKLAGEHYGRMFTQLYGLKTFALRYFNVFGPRQDPKSDYAAVIPLFVDALRNDQAPTIFGDGLQSRDFTYVDDVVEANLCCCKAPEEAAGEAFNVAWGNRTTVLDLVGGIADIMGKSVEPVFEPERPGEVKHSQADATQARERLGWEPKVPFREGLEQTVKWFLEGA